MNAWWTKARLNFSFARWVFVLGWRIGTGRIYILRDAPLSIVFRIVQSNFDMNSRFDRELKSAADEEMKQRLLIMNRANESGDTNALINAVIGKTT